MRDPATLRLYNERCCYKARMLLQLLLPVADLHLFRRNLIKLKTELKQLKSNSKQLKSNLKQLKTILKQLKPNLIHVKCILIQFKMRPQALRTAGIWWCRNLLPTGDQFSQDLMMKMHYQIPNNIAFNHIFKAQKHSRHSDQSRVVVTI